MTKLPGLVFLASVLACASAPKPIPQPETDTVPETETETVTETETETVSETETETVTETVTETEPAMAPEPAATAAPVAQDPSRCTMPTRAYPSWCRDEKPRPRVTPKASR